MQKSNASIMVLLHEQEQFEHKRKYKTQREHAYRNPKNHELK